MKKKKAQAAEERNQTEEKARLHTLLARKSRKSRQLASALRHAQTFRYIDYYGYRF